MKTFCFKLYASRHNNKLLRQINIAGLVYNHCIALHKRYYRLFKKYINANNLKKHLTKLKRTQRFSYIRNLGSQAVQDIVERIERAYNLFWDNLERKIKCSPPTFKRVKHYKSFTLKQSGWKLKESAAAIRIGKRWYRYFQSRNIEGKVKTVTIKRDALGDIYIYLVCENQCLKIEPRTGKSVGLDFGLKKFLTGSDGQDIISPDFFRQNAKNIKTKCRKLSYKQENSHNRKRAKLELARVYRKLERQRRDFHFKTARKLCKEYAVICLETLNIKGMAKLWGRKIHSLGFSDFVKILEYEASKFGTQIVFIPQFYPSSQLCNECGYQNKAVKDLIIRKWDCPNCGAHHDRDMNAAKNIHMVGTSTIGGEPVRRFVKKSAGLLIPQSPAFRYGEYVKPVL